MSVDNAQIYKLITDVRLEIKGDIKDVSEKMDSFVEKRFEPLEKDVGKMKVREATLSTKVYVLVFLIASTVSALITVGAQSLVKAVVKAGVIKRW